MLSCVKETVWVAVPEQPSVIRPFCPWLQQHVELLSFMLYSPSLSKCNKGIPPWCELFCQRNTATAVLKQELDILRESFGSHTALHTDGSKGKIDISDAVATERIIVMPIELYNFRCWNHGSDARTTLNRIKSPIAYTDSLSCFQAICGQQWTKNAVSSKHDVLPKQCSSGATTWPCVGYTAMWA